jgi:mono/diheme cytochrome c family protein
MSRPGCGILVSLIFINVLFGQAPPSSGPRTVWDGVYTAEQARRGRVSFTANCSGCHAGDLGGDIGVALRGDRFVERYREYSLSVLFGAVKAMPPRAPASLPDDAYMDILTYILDVNTFPSGAEALNEEALGSILFVKKSGPEPPPNSSLVLTAGCLNLNSDAAWSLSASSGPIRSLDDAVTPEDLKASQAAPAGTHYFRLQNMDDLSLNPRAHAGHRMAIKGILVRQPGFERINVTDMALIAERCDQQGGW